MSEASQIPVKPYIVIVDDDAAQLALNKELIESSPVGKRFEVRAFANPQELLDTLRVTPTLPALVLTDGTMPQMHGAELTAEIKKDEKLKSIPVLMFTGDGSDILDEKIAAAGGVKPDTIVAKPNFLKMLQALADMLAEVEKSHAASITSAAATIPAPGNITRILSGDSGKSNGIAI